MSPTGQEVSTPASSTLDDDSSPSWTSSPRSKQQRRRPQPRAKVTRSPRGRKTRPRKNSPRPVLINAPFSQTTAHFTDVPVKDMHAWATRPNQQRYDEAKRRGKVARPMNAFMMYKSAYSERAKAFLKMKNFQDVNTALGESWGIEIDEVKTYYIDTSKLEHQNHAAAHPDYQFKPKKGPAVATRPMTPTPSHTTATFMDYGSPSSQWSGELDFSSPPPQYNHGRSQSMEFGDFHAIRSHSNTPFEHPGYPSWSNFPSSAPTVQPSALQGSMTPQSEEIRHFKCSTPLPEEIHYGVPSGLNGIPGEAHHDLMQPQHMHASGVDPQMLAYNETNSISMGMTPTFNSMPNPYPVWGDAPAAHGFLTAPPPTAATTPVSYHGTLSATAFAPELQRNPSWDPSHHSSHDLDDSWIEL